MEEVHRFPTPSLSIGEHLHWDASALFGEVLVGVRRAGASGMLSGIAVDCWGVDYGRLDGAGELLEPPYNYRDSRTDGVPDAFFADFPAERLYGESGLQVMAFNTIFQLVSAREMLTNDLDHRHAATSRSMTDIQRIPSADDWSQVDSCLFLPDLLTYWLSGVRIAELTIASTSGLLDVARRQWSSTTLGHLRDRYDLDLWRCLPDLVDPGTVVGVTRPEILADPVPVVAVGAHDTASAIVAVPATTPHFAYISSGTWSLVGVELDHPILTEASRQANFTNELGVDGTVRYLRNVMGLWVLTESQRRWGEQGLAINLAVLLDEAGRLPALTTVVNMEDPRLLPPGDMPARLAQMARETSQPIPQTPPEFTRCILDSLALDYRRVIRQASQLADTPIDIVHIVGGGCRNHLLNQLTSEATGLPVVAGPAEGTALGNLLIQARAVGALTGDLLALRQVAHASSELRTYSPGTLGLTSQLWKAAEQRAFPAL